MQELKVGYSFDYLKEVFSYILIPVIIVLFIVIIGLFIYSKKEKDHTTERYTYTINFWSYLMCIILSAALFAIALSFVVSLNKSIAGRTVDKTNLIYLVYATPLVPLLFLVITGIRWIKMFLSYKGQTKEQIKEIPKQKEIKTQSIETESIDQPTENTEETFTPIPVIEENKLNNSEEEYVSSNEKKIDKSEELTIDDNKSEEVYPNELENLEEEHGNEILEEDKNVEVLDIDDEEDNYNG